jgi:hypothetical protein
MLLLAWGFFDQSGKLAVVVFEETENAQGLLTREKSTVSWKVYSHLGVMSVLDGFLESSRSVVVLLPRGGYSVVEGGCRGCSDVLVGSGEGCRLHGDLVNSIRTCSGLVVVKSRLACIVRNCLRDGVRRFAVPTRMTTITWISRH